MQKRQQKPVQRYVPQEEPEDDEDESESEGEDEEPTSQDEKFINDDEDEDYSEGSSDEEEAEAPYTQVVSRGGGQYVQVIWGNQVLHETPIVNKPRKAKEAKAEEKKPEPAPTEGKSIPENKQE